MNFLKSVFAAALFGLASGEHYQDGGQMKLRFDQTGEFTVMQLTDLHLGENEDDDLLTLQMIREIIAKEQPDFAAVTGDVVSGYAFIPEQHDWYELQFAKLGQLLQTYNIPFGVVAGYHDYESGYVTSRLQHIYQNYNFCLNGTNGTHTQNGFTFMVPVAQNNGSEDPALRLWFFGTGRNNCLGQGGNDCIRRDQIQWFKDQSEQISDDDQYRGQGIAFMHHALQEHMNLVNSYPVYGSKRDVSGCQAVNTGLFAAMQEEGTVSWVSAGADHSTDFWGDYSGIKLSYGRKTGFSSYGPKFILRGARIFKIDQNNKTIQTHIRQEDGSMDPQMIATPHNEFSWLNKSVCQGAELNQEEIVNNISDERMKLNVSQNLGLDINEKSIKRKTTRKNGKKTSFSDLKFEQE